MHHTTTTPRRARGLAALAGTALTTGVLASTMFAASTVEAAAQTESDVIATSADAALDALDHWNTTGRPAAYAEFVEQREIAATEIAADLDVSADALLEEWDEADEHKQIAMLSAFTQLGVPYRSLASKPGVGFDCSGLTTWAYAQAGVDLPRISGDQIRAAEARDESDAEPGDLAYYPGHVSIYVGQGLMVHSPNSGNRVEVRPIPQRSQRYGDAFTGDLLEDSDIVTVDTTVPVPASEVDDGVIGRRLWGLYWD